MSQNVGVQDNPVSSTAAVWSRRHAALRTALPLSWRICILVATEMGFLLRFGQGFTSTKSAVCVLVPWGDGSVLLSDTQQGAAGRRRRVWQDPLLGLLLLQMWLPSRFVKNRALKKFGKGSSVSTHHAPTGWLWLCKIFVCGRWYAISEYVFLFLVHFPLWLLVVFLHIHQSSQSSLFLTLVLRCEHVSLLCCIAYALAMSRGDGEVFLPQRLLSRMRSRPRKRAARREQAVPLQKRSSSDFGVACCSGSARHSKTPHTQQSYGDEATLPARHRGHVC